MVTNFHNKNFALASLFIMRFKSTRKRPLGQSDKVLLCWMKVLTRSHYIQAKQNETKRQQQQQKQPILLPISKCQPLLKI